MDPLWLLLLGGALLVLSLTSLATIVRLHQCPGCLSMDFGSRGQDVLNHSAGAACRACQRCGCTVQVGEIDSHGHVRSYGAWQRRILNPQFVAPGHSSW